MRLDWSEVNALVVGGVLTGTHFSWAQDQVIGVYGELDGGNVTLRPEF
jgi:hypothetical protein